MIVVYINRDQPKFYKLSNRTHAKKGLDLIENPLKFL